MIQAHRPGNSRCHYNFRMCYHIGTGPEVMAASLEMAEANAVEAANKAVVVVAAQTAKESEGVETGAAAISAVVEVE